MDIARRAIGAFFIGLISAVFAISFAAIIYNGELGVFLDRGIGLTLMGSTALALVGAMCLSYKGSIVAPQDVPAILLAGAAAAMAGTYQLQGEVLFSTVATLVAAAALLTGVAGVLVGRLQLAYVARFVPYPVLAGFLAATGLLLLLGGIGLAIGSSHSVWASMADPETAFKWIPVVVAAVGVTIATRLSSNHMTLPLALIAVVLGYYGLFAAAGYSMADAREAGLLLGPFAGESFLDGLSPAIAAQADWAVIFAQLPVILTVIATSLLGAALNASGLELVVKRDFDLSREVSGTGFANLLASLFGSLPGYHLLGETILANKLGLIGRLAGISSAIGCAAVLVFGAAPLSVLPVGLFASVIAYLGVDLLYSWLWQERARLGRLDYLIVLLIPVIAVTFSFLTAIAVGLLVACAIFVVAYAKLDVVRLVTDLRLRRSIVERPEQELDILRDHGQAARIVELSGYLFFGSSNVLREKMMATITDEPTMPNWLVVDLKRVSGVDISTIRVFGRLARDCADRGIDLVLTGMDQVTAKLLEAENGAGSYKAFDELDSALEWIEDSLISASTRQNTLQDGTILAQIETLLADNSLGGFAERVKVAAGEKLIGLGDATDEMYLLRDGQLSVTLPSNTGAPQAVAQVRAGAVIGEMAYYAGSDRTADIVAEQPSELWKIDMTQLPALEASNPAAALVFHRLIARDLARRLSRTTQLLNQLSE